MGWTFPWASSAGTDFNADFHVRVTEQQQDQGGAEYNYRREAPRKGLEEKGRNETGLWFRRHDEYE